jgi:hypothetical protein
MTSDRKLVSDCIRLRLKMRRTGEPRKSFKTTSMKTLATKRTIKKMVIATMSYSMNAIHQTG